MNVMSVPCHCPFTYTFVSAVYEIIFWINTYLITKSIMTSVPSPVRKRQGGPKLATKVISAQITHLLLHRVRFYHRVGVCRGQIGNGPEYLGTTDVTLEFTATLAAL